MLKALLRKSKKNQKGFTLIELLAVIVILAILAAIAIPSVVSIIHNQNNKATAQDALTVINAAKTFVSDHNVSGTTLVTISNNSAIQGTTRYTSGWSSYVSKSAGTLPTTIKVYYTPNAAGTSGTFSIDDTALSGITGLTDSSQTESGLINFNK
ncbi:MAG: prepilin-type N-terminal cleavage/methylation domain-containing protein [Sporolactobacillus sp.]